MLKARLRFGSHRTLECHCRLLIHRPMPCSLMIPAVVSDKRLDSPRFDFFRGVLRTHNVSGKISILKHLTLTLISVSTVACWSSALTAAILFKTSLRLAAAFSLAVTTAPLALIVVARLQVVKPGAATRKVSSQAWWISQRFRQTADCAGGWLATRAALMRVGALTRSISPTAEHRRVHRRLP